MNKAKLAYLKFRTVAVICILTGGYLLPAWLAAEICEGIPENTACRRPVLTAVFTVAYLLALMGQAWLYPRLVVTEERCWYKRLALLLWLFLALSGTAIMLIMIF